MVNREIVQIELLDSTIVKRKSEQQFSVIDDEVIMLNVSKAEYYALNTVASKIWELIENPVSIKKIVLLLLEEYEVDPDRCKLETLECIEEFIDRELVEVENA